MAVWAAVLAAGQGLRFGSDKTVATLGGKPVWRWSCETFIAHPEVEGLILVGSPQNLPEFERCPLPGVRLVEGGKTRQESAHNAVNALPADAELLLIHDAARPFISLDLVSRVIRAARQSGAAAPGVAVTDTIRRHSDGKLELVDRSSLVAMQTPQGVSVELLRKAHAQAAQEYTDDIALAEAVGVSPQIVPGEAAAFKITGPLDLRRAEGLLSEMQTRTGFGYDIHPFSSDDSRTLMLGGVAFPGHPALAGHSDADVLLHAVTDALLGAAALGDIGVHFPNTDPRWKDAPSLLFLRHAAKLVGEAGWRLVNIDATLVAEVPKVMGRAAEIRTQIADALGLAVNAVSLKATTNEGLGSIGRREGIAAYAMATLFGGSEASPGYQSS